MAAIWYTTSVLLAPVSMYIFTRTAVVPTHSDVPATMSSRLLRIVAPLDRTVASIASITASCAK